MKSIVIFTRTIDPAGYPFSDDYHLNAYQDLLLALRSGGAEAFFATDNATYLGEGQFSQGRTISAKTSVKDFTQVGPIRAGLVVEKGGFTGQDVLVLNPPFVHTITSDKAETYRHFARYQPKTITCSNRLELEQAFQEIQTDLIVVKEPVSNRGMAVLIGQRSEVLPQLGDAYPLIVQEFIDTSIGIKNHVEGIHDIRVKIGGGRIFGGMIRTPAPGDYRANLAQGGTARHLMPEEIPTEVVSLALEIDRYFEKYPRYYALDFANTPDGYKLIELNSKPGFVPFSVSPAAEYAMRQLAEYLLEICPEANA